MVVHITYILSFVIVKTAVLWPIGSRERLSAIFALKDVEIEDLIVLQYLCLLVIE